MLLILVHPGQSLPGQASQTGTRAVDLGDGSWLPVSGWNGHGEEQETTPLLSFPQTPHLSPASRII